MKKANHAITNECSCRRLRGFKWLCYVACVCLLACQSGEWCCKGQETDNISTNSALVAYLEDTPWLVDVLFVASSFNVAASPSGEIKYQDWILATNRAAVQPSGLYFEMLNPNPPKFTTPATSTQRVVLGMSDKHIWQGNIDSRLLSYSSRDPKLGWSDSNLLQLVAKNFEKNQIDPVRYFGFPALLKNSFQLVGGSNIKATTGDGELLEGSILAMTNGLVSEVRYGIISKNDDYFILRYGYKNNEKLPSYIERKQFHNDGTEFGLPLTNWIEKISYGVDPGATNGYSYSTFFRNAGVFSQIIMESNGQRHLVSVKGDLTPVVEKWTPQVIPNRANKFFAGLILVVFLVGSSYFVWKVGSRRGQQTTEER